MSANDSSGSKRSTGESFFFILVRGFVLVVALAIWLSLGLVVWVWMVVRASLAFSWAMIGGLLHGGRDYSGEARSLENLAGLWYRGILQIFDSVDPSKTPRIQDAVAFDARKVVIDCIFALAFIVVLIFAGEFFRLAIWRPLFGSDRLISASTPIYNVAEILNATDEDVTFSQRKENKWVECTLKPGQPFFAFAKSSLLEIGFKESPNAKFGTYTLDPVQHCIGSNIDRLRWSELEVYKFGKNRDGKLVLFLPKK